MNNTALIPKLSGSPFAVMPPAERLCLSADDLAVLTASETIIERGNKTFVEVGRALLTIRDHENGVLYKQRYGTFENYWRERWEFEHAHVYRLMDAAKIYDELAPTGVVAPSAPLPTTERQIRALKGLPTPALRRKAWGEAIQTATEYPISTATVEKAVTPTCTRIGTIATVIMADLPLAMASPFLSERCAKSAIFPGSFRR